MFYYNGNEFLNEVVRIIRPATEKWCERTELFGCGIERRIVKDRRDFHVNRVNVIQSGSKVTRR